VLGAKVVLLEAPFEPEPVASNREQHVHRHQDDDT
jgi:hypothetical protein